MRHTICPLAFALLLSACDKPNTPLVTFKPTYSSCLQAAVAGGTNLSAADIRDLCAEAADVLSPLYKWENEKTVPGDDFTRCYDKEKKDFEAAKVPRADRLAKLSCKYPDLK